MRAIRVSDVEAKLILTLDELNVAYISRGRHFICGVLILSLEKHLKLKSIDPKLSVHSMFEYSDVFDWDVTTRCFHDQWVKYIGADDSHWDSYFTDWHKGTKYEHIGGVTNYNEGVAYRSRVLGECANADPKYEFCIDMKISPEYFDGCFRFEDGYAS